MNGTAVTAAVRDAQVTRLDRLGSQQSLLALTDAQLDAETVLRRAAVAELVAEKTFAAWADSEGNGKVREAFASVAEREAEHAERVLAHLDSDAGLDPDFDLDLDANPTTDTLHEHLRGLNDTVGRIGAGLVGRSLVADRTTLQLVNFFVNEADERRADCFRDLREDTRAMRGEGEELLDACCEAESDYERGRAAAEEAVEIAYEEYAASLEGMGFDPRPVC